MRIPKWDCIPPLETPCSFGSCIKRELLGDFKLKAGTALSRRNLGEDGRALTNFCGKSAKVPSNAGSFAHLRSAFIALRRDKSTSRNFSARFAGMYPANFFYMRSRRTPALCGVPPHDLLVGFIVL